MTWLNNDGLLLKFNTEEATPVVGGELSPVDNQIKIEFDLDYSDFTSATAGAVIVMDNVAVPKGLRVERVQIVTETAFDSAGDAFVFNVGLVQLDRSTEIDFNGLVAALPQSSVDAAGEIQEVIIGHTYVGALVGTTTAAAGLVCIDYDTAAPTAGKAVVRIIGYVP